MAILIIALVIATLVYLFQNRIANGFITAITHGEQKTWSEYIGKKGEDYISDELSKLQKYGIDGSILKNIYIPKDNSDTTEIDVVFITTKGAFVIESKNYSGWIFGNEDSQYWTVTLPNKIKNKFYNPVKQNRTHIKWLEKYLQMNIPMYSLIVFSDRCEFKKLQCHCPNLSVIHRKYMGQEIRRVMDGAPNVLSLEQIERIYGLLQPLTNADKATKEHHIERIKQKYVRNDIGYIPVNVSYEQSQIKTETLHSIEKNDNELVCPKCGSPLVLRKAKRGTKAGDDFYGCSNYPKCRYSQSLKIETEHILSEDTRSVEYETDTQIVPVTEKADISKDDPMICPRCGGKLVLRTAKKGENAGNSFYGCSNFPKCRYTKY